jgi:hypothetical protein
MVGSPPRELAATDSSSGNNAPAQVSEQIESPPLRPQPVHQISLKVANGAASQLDIQVVEHAGSVRIAVKTPDQDLTKTLQTNLGELVGRLEEKGYKTETWIPAPQIHSMAAPIETSGGSGYSQDQPGHYGQFGSDAGSQQQRQQQDQGGERQGRWITQLNESLDSDDTIGDVGMEDH